MQLNLKQTIYANGLVPLYDKLCVHFMKTKELPTQLLTRRLCVASERPPERVEDYYYRAASILFKLIENPVGIRKLTRAYSRMKRSKVSPPKRHLGTRSLIKTYLIYLGQLDLISRTSKGYYVNSKGKSLIKSLI